MPRHRPRLPLVCGGLAILVMALGGCGGDDDESPTATGAATGASGAAEASVPPGITSAELGRVYTDLVAAGFDVRAADDFDIDVGFTKVKPADGLVVTQGTSNPDHYARVLEYSSAGDLEEVQADARKEYGEDPPQHAEGTVLILGLTDNQDFVDEVVAGAYPGS